MFWNEPKCEVNRHENTKKETYYIVLNWPPHTHTEYIYIYIYIYIYWRTICCLFLFQMNHHPGDKLLFLVTKHRKDIQLPLQWRHNEHDGVSNHQPRDCLLSRFFRRRSKKTSKLRVTGLYEWNSPVTGEFPAPMASNAEMFSFDDVIMQMWNIRTDCTQFKYSEAIDVKPDKQTSIIFSEGIEQPV